MTEKLDVLFRADRKKDPEITAVFPSEVGTNEYNMTCYAHIGQHGSCRMGWYRTTRAAKPEEYAALLAELRQIYLPEYELVVKQRATRQHRAHRQQQARDLRRIA